MTLPEPDESVPDAEIGKGLSPFHVMLVENEVASSQSTLVGVSDHDSVAEFPLTFSSNW